jgi:hypothetical protein
MTIKRVKQAAACRGIYFSGERKWLNNTVGYGYEFYTPNGCGFRQADTLEGSYRQVMEFPKVRKEYRL